MNELNNKIAVVTGAGSGIGEQLQQHLEIMVLKSY